MHYKSVFVAGKVAPLNRTHDIHHLGFLFSTEGACSQPGTASGRFNLGICNSVQVTQKPRVRFSLWKADAFKIQGANSWHNGLILLQILQKRKLKVVGKIWPAQKARVPPENQQLPWEAPKGNEDQSQLELWCTKGSVIYTDLYKMEDTLWNLFLQLHFLGIRLSLFTDNSGT